LNIATVLVGGALFLPITSSFGPAAPALGIYEEEPTEEEEPTTESQGTDNLYNLSNSLRITL